MISKTSVFLTIVGTVAVGAYLPRKIDDSYHGWGYGIRAYNNGSYEYEGYTQFSWDFDLNCFYAYGQSYEDYSWAEASYCNNYLKAYDSESYQCYNEYVGYVDIEGETDSYFNKFYLDHGYLADPVWGYGSFRVLEHGVENVYIYLNDNDAIEYIVEYSYGGSSDNVMYFPYGLVADNYTYYDWEFDLKYGYCPSYKSTNYKKALGVLRPKSLKSESSPLKALPANATVRPTALLTDVKKIAKKAEVAPIAKKMTSFFGMNLFSNHTVEENANYTTEFRHMAMVMSNFARVNLYDAQLEQEVDQFFAIADLNGDGYLSPAEIDYVYTAYGYPLSDDEVALIFLIADLDQDGYISWYEMYTLAQQNSAKSLYSKSEVTDIVFQFYDYNGDGYLSNYEFTNFLQDSDPTLTQDYIDQIFYIIDSNGDYYISWYELYTVIQV